MCADALWTATQFVIVNNPTCRAVEIENMEILLARAKTSLPTKPRDIKKEFRGWMGLRQIYSNRNGVRIKSQLARFVQQLTLAKHLKVAK